MKAQKQPYNHKRLQEDCDNYTNSVIALLALVNELRWDSVSRTLSKSVQYELGRRMTTSKRNAITKLTDVTPDAVVQSNNGGVVEGVIAEVTAKLTRDEAAWKQKLVQLRKYDDDLSGWWTESEELNTHDIVAIVQLSRAVLFSDIVRAAASDSANPTVFSRNLVIVGYDRATGATQEYMTLLKFHGDLANSKLSARLRGSVKVPLEAIVVEYSDKKFVDHEPPTAYLLQILWENLFSSYVDPEFFEQKQTTTSIKISAERVTADLQEFYGFPKTSDRSAQVPRLAWVQKALDSLVLIDLAKKDGDTYFVAYKRFRGDSLKRLGKMLHDKVSGMNVLKGQIPMFGAASAPSEEPEAED